MSITVMEKKNFMIPGIQFYVRFIKLKFMTSETYIRKFKIKLNTLTGISVNRT